MLAAMNQNIRVTECVEDIRPYVEKAAVYIVPLRIGGGTRLKIFEAMAMSKAVVSTTIGAEGLPVKDGVNILIADSPEEFARRVTMLLASSETRTQLGKAARELVETKFGWPVVASYFESVLAKLSARGGVRASENQRQACVHASGTVSN